MKTLEFLTALFEDKEPDDYILIWKKAGQGKKGGRSHWFKSIEGAAQFAVDSTGDLYVGAGLSGKDYGPKKRCESKNIVGIPGYWVDVDIKHESKDIHKKENLPDNIAQARELVEGHGFDPTIIINSGHGLHCWWLFKEIWRLDTAEEHAKASEGVRKMTNVIAKRAAKHSWSIDGTHDLARVYRIPGTMNHKDPENIVRVCVI